MGRPDRIRSGGKTPGLIGGGHGIHWEDLDEDISVAGLLGGKPSSESQASFAKWLRGRRPDS